MADTLWNEDTDDDLSEWGRTLEEEEDVANLERP